MKFYILTLFPEMIENVLGTSIIGRAVDRGLISYEAINIRDFTLDKHKKVVIIPTAAGRAWLCRLSPFMTHGNQRRAGADGPVRTVYLTPQGETFSQAKAKELALEENLILLCGHYEGVDERVLEEIVTDYISIGDYVLTGGELPAVVVVDAVSRMVPGVLSNRESGETESFEDGLLEYPQYSRPEIWHDRAVPSILLSGNHQKVDEWRRQQSLLRTRERRPDLLKTANLTEKDKKYLNFEVPYGKLH